MLKLYVFFGFLSWSDFILWMFNIYGITTFINQLNTWKKKNSPHRTLALLWMCEDQHFWSDPSSNANQPPCWRESPTDHRALPMLESPFQAWAGSSVRWCSWEMMHLVGSRSWHWRSKYPTCVPVDMFFSNLVQCTWIGSHHNRTVFNCFIS